MRENIRQTLTDATFEVFEKMFFVFLELVESGPFQYEHVSCIDFDGTEKGTLCVMMSRGMTEMMVQNMLGCGPSEMTEQIIEDCAKEAANMVCGNFLRKMSERDVFDLSLPKYAPMKEAPALGMTSTDSGGVEAVFFESEGERLHLRISWQERRSG